MKKKRPIIAVVTLIVVAAIIALFVEDFRVEDFHIVEPRVLYTCGQPRGMDYLRLLYKYHVVTWVNVRPVTEDLQANWYPAEMNFVRENGLAYHTLSIDRDAAVPDPVTCRRFLDIMAQAVNRPVLLHGDRNDRRVALLTALWLRKGLNLSPEQALARVRAMPGGRDLAAEHLAFIDALMP